VGFFISTLDDSSHMDFQIALTHLKDQFPGRAVLYVNDLAQVLGKSESALSHLLTRHELPFQVRKVGRERCVDIFQVAQWLSGAMDSKNPPEKPTAGVKAPSPKTKSASKGVELLTPMMASILNSRHDAPQALARFASELTDPDGRCFMTEVAAQLMFSRESVPSQFVVQLRRNESIDLGGMMRGDETAHFDTHAAAHGYLRSLQSRSYGDAAVRLMLKRGRLVLQHSFYIDGQWHVVELSPLHKRGKSWGFGDPF